MPSYQIPLSNGMIALVDEADAELVAGYPWYAHRDKSGHWYVNANVRDDGKWRRTLVLHRLILDAPKGVRVDHIDGNGLNCQRHNLRLCNAAQNGWNRRIGKANTTGYRGVSRVSPAGLWKASLRCHRETVQIGTFDSPEKAAHAYDEKARELYGSFASLNFPRPGEQSARDQVDYPKPLISPRLIRRWARRHNACTDCGTTERSHAAGGLCVACYREMYKEKRRSQGERALGPASAAG